MYVCIYVCMYIRQKSLYRFDWSKVERINKYSDNILYWKSLIKLNRFYGISSVALVSNNCKFILKMHGAAIAIYFYT